MAQRAIYQQLVVIVCCSHLKMQARQWMEGEVSSLVGSIVLQRQHTDAIGTWFDGAIVVNHTTNATCATQHAFAKDIGDGFSGA